MKRHFTTVIEQGGGRGGIGRGDHVTMPNDDVWNGYAEAIVAVLKEGET